MRIGFIGAGKVGCSLGKYFAENDLTLSGYFSKSPDSAAYAAEFTKTECFSDMEELAEKSEILFLTVPDGMIQPVWEQLKNLPLQQKIICHCSGCISSAIFSEISHVGAYGCSIHPLFAVPDRGQSYRELSHCVFTVEGAEHALAIMKPLLKKCGNTVVEILPEEKTKYHAAAACASNLVTALISMSAELFMECGFREEEAYKAMKPLVCGNLEHIFCEGAAEALTGPIERNDVETVEKHLACLSGRKKEVYRLLSEELITLARKKHGNRDYEKMEDLLK